MGYAILLDIGNTNIKIGFTGSDGAIEAFSLPTVKDYTADSLGLSLQQLILSCGRDKRDIEMILIASVVPNLNPLVRQACVRFCGAEPRFVPDDLPLSLENRYAEPRQVGADRLVGAFAARQLYPEPASIICIDFGTATTFDCVEGNAYLGGLICPGVLSSASALAGKTAKLPAVSLEVAEAMPVPGRSTSTSINHGFIFGFAAMAEGLCARLAQGLPKPNFVLATGGFSTPLAKVTNCFHAVRADLLLEGLRILYLQHK